LDLKVKEEEARLKEERAEIARLKSLECIRKKKMDSMKRQMGEEMKKKEVELQRKKASFECEMREQ